MSKGAMQVQAVAKVLPQLSHAEIRQLLSLCGRQYSLKPMPMMSLILLMIFLCMHEASLYLYVAAAMKRRP